MAKWRKYVLFGISLVMGLIIVGMVGVVGFIQTDRARRWAIDAINRQIPGHVQWDSQQLSLLTGELALAGIKITTPGRTVPLALADRLVIDWSWWPLLGKKIVLRKLDLQHPRIAVRRESDGRLNLIAAFTADREPSTGPPAPSPSMPNLKIVSLNISNGHIQYQDPALGASVILSGMDISAAGQLSSRRGELDIAIDKVQAAFPDVSMDVAPVTIKGELIKDRIENLAIQFRQGKSDLHLSGYVDHLFDTPTVNLDVNTSVDLAGLKSLLPSLPRATGQVTIRLQAVGDMGNPDVRVVLKYGGGNIEGQRVDALTAHLDITDRQVSVADTSLDLPGGHWFLTGSTVDLRPVFPNGWIDSTPNIDSVTYHLALRLRNGILDTLPTVQDYINGTIQSGLTLDGKGISPDRLSCRGEWNLKGPVRLVVAPDLPLDLRTTANFSVANGRILLDRLSMTTGSMTLDAAGEGTLSGDEINGRVSLHVPRLGQVSSLINGKNVSGSVQLDAGISGSLKKPAMTAKLAGQALTLDQITLGDINLDAVLAPDRRLSVSQFVIKNQAALIRGNGFVSLFDDRFAVNRALPLDLTLTLKDVGAAEFVGKTTFGGRFNGQVKLIGTPDTLAGVAHITGKSVRFPGIQPLDLAAALTLKGGVLQVKPLSLEFGPSTISLAGRATIIDPFTGQWIDDPALVVGIEGRQIQLSDIVSDYRGIIAVTAQLNGPVTAMAGKFQLKGRDVDLKGQVLPEITLAGRLAPKKVFVDTFRIEAGPKETVSGDGWYGFDHTFAFQIASEGIHLDRIDYLRKKTGLAGRVGFSITGQGTKAAPQMSGALTLTALTVSGLSLDDIYLEGSLVDQQFRVTGRQTDTFFSGAYQLTDGIFNGHLVLAATRLDPYFAWKGKPDLSGKLTGSMTLSGDVHELDKIDIVGKITDLALFLKQDELVRAQGVDLSYRNETLSLPEFECRLLKKGFLTIQGQGNRSGSIRLVVNGDIPLVVVAPFSEALAGLNGRVRLSGRVAGTLAHPTLSADVDLSDATFPIPHLDQSIRGVNGRIRLTSRAIAIEKLVGKLDTGHFSITGKVTLDKFQPVSTDLHLSATGLPLEIPDTADLLLDADLSLTGHWDAATLGGTVVLLEGTYFRDLNLNLLTGLSKMTEKKRTVTPPPQPFSNPFPANLTLDIDVRRRQPFRVDNDLADLEVNPDLKVIGKLNRLVLTGRADVVSGQVRFEQRKFAIQKGVIAFLNPYRTEPDFDISGKTTIRTWDITLAVTGTPDALRVQLTSEPPLVQDDIVSLLILGKTSGELIEGEGGQSKSSTQLLTDLAASAFGDDIRKVTGLDLLEVDTREYEEDGNPEERVNTHSTDRVKVTIGKNLSRRLTVKYAMESKDGELTQRTDAEYQLREHLLVSGFQGSDGIYGGQFLFRLEFR